MSPFIHNTNNSARYSIIWDLNTLCSGLQNAELLLDMSYQILIDNIFDVNNICKLKLFLS